MILLPYARIGGVWNIPDELMKGLYTKLRAQGLHRTVFYDESVNSEDEFLVIMQNGSNLPVIAFDKVDKIPIGVGWINGISHHYALCHHFFYKEFWGKKTVEAAKKIISYWFAMTDENGEPLFLALLGITPPKNRLAVGFIKRIDFTVLGEIPPIGVISYAEKDKWEANQANQIRQRLEPPTANPD